MLMDLQEKDMGAHKKIPAVNKTPKLTFRTLFKNSLGVTQ